VLNESAPGLLIIGSAARPLFKERRGVLRGRRVLLTCSEGIMGKAIRCVVDFGGTPIARPMIKLIACEDVKRQLNSVAQYDWIVLTSPASGGIFMQMLLHSGVDLRTLPRIMTCGAGTAANLTAYGIKPDLTPPMIYSAEGLREELASVDLVGRRVLRLRSTLAGTLLTDALLEKGAIVDDVILYRNQYITYSDIPDFDVVFFASASAVDAFMTQFDVNVLSGKFTLAIGAPTAQTLEKYGVQCDCVADKATVPGAIDALARSFMQRLLL